MDTESMELDFEMEAYSEFLSTYPAYKDTMVIDSLRREEYPHLDEKGQACLDYTGVGLFSSAQKRSEFDDGAGIGLSHISSNLATHAMYTEEGSTESYFRKRVLRYLNLDEDDYYIVLTANAFSAFKLLGASYPFHEAPNLLLAYDHRCENVDAISECSLAKSESVALSFPWCTCDADDLKKKLQCKKKGSVQKVGMKKGLFAFPYSSRVTGCRSSSTWIPQAQQNGWHVLLDLTSMDAKMLDSLGLSQFLPDFVICSFYNVFGEDPTGLGCLAIKKSVLRTLGDSSRARAIGMVKIVNKRASPSDSSVSLEHKSEHTNDSRSQSPTGDSLIRSPLEHSLLFQPEWSADLVAIDNNLFYQSNGSDTNGSKVVLHRDRGVVHGVMNGKGSSYANSSQLRTCEHEKGALDGGMNTLDGVLDHRESTSANTSQAPLDRGSTSFSMWMADQLLHSGSFRSISTREWDERDLNFASASHNHVAFLQDEMGVGVGPSWQRRVPEIQEIEPSYSHSSNSMRANGQALRQVHPDPSTSRNLKGMFYGDFGPNHSAHGRSLRRLFRHETKAGVVEHLQRAGQGEVLTVNDWMTFYASKGRVWSSNSSNTSSSAPPSRRFSMEDWLEGDKHCTKAAGVGTQNKVECKGLDHADMLGYKRIAIRLQSLADWLIFSISRLQHPPPKCFKLVKLCSRISLADRGSTVAFTLLDSSGNTFDVKRVQLLADRHNISIGTGVIEGTLSPESLERDKHKEELMVGCVELPGVKCRSKDDTVQRLELPVLYVSLGFLNNFSDVYRLWRFVCRFLDPHFIDQELWHYQALNQETIEI